MRGNSLSSNEKKRLLPGWRALGGDPIAKNYLRSDARPEFSHIGVKLSSR